MFGINTDYLIKTRPLSEEVKASIIRYIKAMDLNKSNKLPNEYLLSNLFGVSRITIRSALNELASEGIIFRQKGRGTFVNLEALQMKVTFNPAVEFEDMIRNSGYEANVEIAKVFSEPASSKLANLLQIEVNDELFVIERIFYADKSPAALCIDYFPKKYIQEEISPEEYSLSIFKILYSKCGKKVTWDKVELSTVSIGEYPSLGKYFNSNNAIKSLLLCEAINFDEFNKPIFYAAEYIDPDYIRFNVIRQKDVSY